MLNKSITLKHLLICTLFLIFAFFICGVITDHPLVDTKAIFSGAILGTVVTFVGAIYFTSVINRVKGE